MTATSAIPAALSQLDLILAAFDARDQQRRGHDSHVPLPTDAELRQRVELAVAMLSGCGE